MTAWDSTIVPTKDVRYDPDTRTYEVRVNGQRIGSAPTMLQGYELANEYIYQQLTREHLDPADLAQDDAEAIFFMLHHISISDAEAPQSADETIDANPWTASAVNRMVFKMTDADHTVFWNHVQQTDGCWNWQGGMTSQWYGYYKGQLAHRVAYVLTYGPIPAGLMICHHCDHPPCVRPDHLFLGTAADNRHDYVSKGFRSGRGIPSNTLWSRVCTQISRKEWRDRRPLTYGKICQESGIDRYTFYGIISGHLREIPPEALALLCAYFECTEKALLGSKK